MNLKHKVFITKDGIKKEIKSKTGRFIELLLTSQFTCQMMMKWKLMEK